MGMGCSHQVGNELHLHEWAKSSHVGHVLSAAAIKVHSFLFWAEAAANGCMICFFFVFYPHGFLILSTLQVWCACRRCSSNGLLCAPSLLIPPTPQQLLQSRAALRSTAQHERRERDAASLGLRRLHRRAMQACKSL